jgi:radical SAM superfamily enzyme YgiQ (UPF0313 family)
MNTSGLVEALVSNGPKKTAIVGRRVAFSPYRLFRCESLDGNFCKEFSSYLSKYDFYITDAIGKDFLEEFGVIPNRIVLVPEWVLTKEDSKTIASLIRATIIASGDTTSKTVLNAMSRFSDRLAVTKILETCNILSDNLENLNGFNLDLIPSAVLVPIPTNIYPINIPEIDISPNLDFVVIDCPARNLSLLPNGIAYLEVALKKHGVNFEVLDVDVIAYHLFHMHRIFDLGHKVIQAGVELPTDPWLAHNYDAWSSLSEHENNGEGISTQQPIHQFFNFLLDTVSRELVRAKPKVVGFSIQQCSEVMSAQLIGLIREKGLNSPVVVGGFSCYNFDIGLRGFPLADYMCIGEAETTIGILLRELIKSGVARDLPGVLSKLDSPNRVFTAAPMIHDLNTIDFPKYSWTDLKAYVNWDGYQLVPIIASRGCRWSRCTFCAERFYWRIRSAKDFVDELEWHVSRGHYLFMFNESDLNGMPERVLEICDEIIRRGLHKKVKLTGQLRIHRKSDRAFFQKLHHAGFVALRFGVDSFSRNGMKLQQKGYTPEIVSQNLRDCSEAGIFVEVNWVIGVPGETEEDIDEGIDFILENRNYIGRLANLNPLILVNGSVYWLNPSEYKISFKGEWEELKEKYPRAIPAALWWSEDPYIDASVRQKWFLKVVSELYKKGFPIGDWARQVISDVESRKDKARTGDIENKSKIPDLEIIDDHEKVYTFLETYRGYALFSSGDDFFATNEQEASKSEINLEAKALFKEKDFTLIKQRIDEAIDWANTRGVYKGKEAGTVMRADSNLVHVGFEEKFEIVNKKIVRISGNLFFMPENAETIKLRIERTFIIRNLRRAARRVEYLRWLVDVIQAIGMKSSSFYRPMKTTSSNLTHISAVGAVPELISSWDDVRLNIVRFDGMFYAVPQGVSIDFMDADSRFSSIDKFVSDSRLGDLIQKLQLQIEEDIDSTQGLIIANSNKKEESLPRLISNVGEFNIVAYDGFYYAIPRAIGPVDLTKTDVTEDERVFRDVSEYAAESYALENSVHSQSEKLQ